MKAFAIASMIALAIAPAAFAQSGHSMAGHGGDHMTQAQAGMAGTGSVDAVHADRHQVKLTHGPIKALGWPAMTMDFAVADGVDLSTVKAGDKVEFELARGADGIYMIQRMTRK